MEHFNSDGVQYAWDSTSLRAFMKCPRYYQFKIKEQLALSSDDKEALYFGIMFHSVLEYYYKNDKNKEETLRYALQISYDWDDNDHAPQRQREPFVKLVCQYMAHYVEDKIETVKLANGKKAIEQSFKIPMDGFVLCGHIDRVGKFYDKVYVIDIKTTKSTLTPKYFERYANDVQMTFYVTAADMIFEGIETDGAIIDACQPTVGKRIDSCPNFMQQVIVRDQHHKDELVQETIPSAMSIIKFYNKKELFPMNQTACYDFLRPCEYLPLCTAKKELHPMIKQAQFIKREWNPLDVR